MTRRRTRSPDLFEEIGPDPIDAACGPRPTVPPEPAPRPQRPGAGADFKRKAGFYLPEELLERFNMKFYQLKLAGAAVDNKSALLEAAGFRVRAVVATHPNPKLTAPDDLDLVRALDAREARCG